MKSLEEVKKLSKKESIQVEEGQEQSWIKMKDLPNELREARPMFEEEEGFYSEARKEAEKTWLLSEPDQLEKLTAYVSGLTRGAHKSIFVKRFLQSITDKDQLPRAVSILLHLLVERAISKLQVRRGFDRYFMDLDEILIDSPLAGEESAALLVSLAKESVFCSKILAKLPADTLEKLRASEVFSEFFSDDLELLTDIRAIKDRYQDLVLNYLASGSFEDIDAYFNARAEHFQICHLFVRKAIEVGLDADNNARERISVLLKHCTDELEFTSVDFAYSFDHMLQHFSTYEADVP